MNTIEQLESEGWKEYPDQFRKYSRCFFKRFDTPTRCACNDDKAGIQVCFAVSEHEDCESIEADVSGELKDGSWVKIHQWAIPRGVGECLKMIPRMLRTWEAIANDQPP